MLQKKRTHMRKTKKQRVTYSKKDSGLMAEMFGEEEHVPKWACQLLSEIQSVKETCNVRFDNLDKAIVQLKKDSKATSQRINNAEKRISG
ncbi:hypothetical protein F7725_005026 [Dissostichus mawsoni]|uniref:Uncharacterized protein n=1 Tax=Dissostichus mawsoni TaxID=36200 RepID=A0A7J5XKF8_DISMA|nr:hypothetical protein F7725_005026 [Dissostichus mawsoni]